MTKPVTLGVLEIAKMLGVRDRTVHQWINRDLFPDSDGPPVLGFRTWKRATVLAWAGETGRLRTTELQAEFQRRFRRPPRPPRSGGRIPVTTRKG